MFRWLEAFHQTWSGEFRAIFHPCWAITIDSIQNMTGVSIGELQPGSFRWGLSNIHPIVREGLMFKLEDEVV